jgi:hypothetical protein
VSFEVGLLREAATQMRERATAASSGERWSAGDAIDGTFYNQYGDFGWYVTGPAGSPEFADSEQGKADAVHVASWDGPPALAVADLLTKAADAYQTERDHVACADDCPPGCVGHGVAEFHVACDSVVDECQCLAPFVAVARAFLRREAVEADA